VKYKAFIKRHPHGRAPEKNDATETVALKGEDSMKLKTLLVASSLALSMNAYADTLFTPALFPIAPDSLACDLINVGDENRTVRVRIISQGDVLLDGGKVTLAPQHSANERVTGFPEGGSIYCEFTVEGFKEQYRGVAKIFHPNSSDFVAVPAQ